MTKIIVDRPWPEKYESPANGRTFLINLVWGAEDAAPIGYRLLEGNVCTAEEFFGFNSMDDAVKAARSMADSLKRVEEKTEERDQSVL